MKKIFYGTTVIILAVATFFWLFYSVKDYPQTPDEVVYTLCSHSFIKWIKSPSPFSKEVLLKYWNIGYEHPSFVKILSGFSWAMFHNKVGDLVSYRLATMFNFSILIVVLYIFLTPHIGRSMAICSSIFLLCIPEVITYAHFAEININLALLWFLTVMFFLKGLKTKYWIYFSGIFFGLALGSKITTLIIPISMLVWIIVEKPPKSISAYIIFLLIGILTFFLSWPSLLLEFPQGLIEHIKFYISSLSTVPARPWYFVLKEFFFSFPPGVMILFIIGGIGVLVENNKFGVLLLINMITLFVIFSIIPFYPEEGIRYFLPSIPFVTILCAMGLKFLITPLVKRKIVYV